MGEKWGRGRKGIRGETNRLHKSFILMTFYPPDSDKKGLPSHHYTFPSFHSSECNRGAKQVSCTSRDTGMGRGRERGEERTNERENTILIQCRMEAWYGRSLAMRWVQQPCTEKVCVMEARHRRGLNVDSEDSIVSGTGQSLGTVTL